MNQNPQHREAPFLAASAIAQAAFWLSLIALNLGHVHRAPAVLLSLGSAAAATFASRKWWKRAGERPSFSPDRFKDHSNGSRAERREAQKRAAKRLK